MRVNVRFLNAIALTLALCFCRAVADERANVAQTDQTIDFSLFDVPDGKDAAFYKERLDAIQDAINSLRLTDEESERIDKAVSDAFLTIFKNLAESDDLNSNERDQYFKTYLTQLLKNDRLDEIVALLDAEKAKDKPDMNRVGTTEFLLLRVKIERTGESDEAALKAVAAETVEKATTIDVVAENARDLCDVLSYFDEELGKATFADVVDAFKRSDNPLRKRLADEFVGEMERDLLISKFREAQETKNADALKEVAAELIDKSSTSAPVANMARDFCDAIAEIDEELGKSTFKTILAAFENSDDPFRKSLAERFAGVERFNNLVGNDVLVEGLFLDGKEIKWDEYRGKVVLIDFWATWCGPCRAEIPNVRELYEKYRDAGFEVVGYSLDDDLDALRKFENKEKLPWKTMSEKLSTDKKNDRGEPVYKSLSAYYGVRFIPTMILVGKDGKALDTEARGDRLKELLEKQFPDVK